MTTTRFDDAPFHRRMWQSIKAVGVVLLRSHKVKLPRESGEIIILGNGPSLADTIAKSGDRLKQSKCMAVNFFANTPEFRIVKPRYYILADPHFFRNTSDVNVSRLLDNIRSVDWPMTLLVPFAAGESLPVHDNDFLDIKRYNALGAEGFDWLTDRLYAAGRAMPRPRNVLIPAIMTSVAMGFTRIIIVGADHSWTRTLSVDDDNHVVSVQPHFYKEDKDEVKRITTEYLNYPLHKILESFRVAFEAYHRIERFGRSRGVEILNATPGSFIDAFARVNKL